VLLDDDGPRVVLLDGNPLAGSGFVLPTGLGAPAAAVRSGAIEPESDDEFDRLDAARRSWSGEGRALFDDAWARLAAEAEQSGAALWIHPRAGDVVGDIPGLRLLASGEIRAAGVLLEPAALLTAGMIDDAEDHFARMIEPLENGGPLAVTLITNTRPANGDGNGLGDRVPIDEGVIDPGVLLGLARRAAGSGPVAVLPGDAERVHAAVS